MTLHVALALSALVGSAILLLANVARPAAAVALVASALEVAMALGVLRIHAAGVPLGLALGLALAVTGLLAWLRASAKTAIAAASVVAFVGVLQVLVAVQAHI
ncbi:MAG TPA: hypothetical protein VF875_14195 [Anaeromyxobacter sp.]